MSDMAMLRQQLRLRTCARVFLWSEVSRHCRVVGVAGRIGEGDSEWKVAALQQRAPFGATYSDSLRIFFRARFRAKACFTRFFSPGFR